jgi:hypothetical protein
VFLKCSVEITEDYLYWVLWLYLETFHTKQNNILQSKCTSSKITSFGSCIVLKHSKSTLANTWAFPGNILVKRNCLDRCIDGYYGNPSLGQSCHPCLCPDVPSSNQYFAHSCYQNPWSSAINCSCLQGYAGMKYSLYFPSSIPHCNLNKITCS